MATRSVLPSYPQASAWHRPVENFGVRALVGLAACLSVLLPTHYSPLTTHDLAEAATYQLTPTGGQLVVGCRLAGNLRKADQVTAVIERDGEVAKQAHAANDEGTMLMWRKDAPQAKRIGADFHRQPSSIDSKPVAFDSEKRVLGTLTHIDPEFCFRDGSGNHRAVSTRIDEKIKWQIAVAR